MERKPYEFPNINAQHENIEDYKVEDFELSDYVHESIKWICVNNL